MPTVQGLSKTAANYRRAPKPEVSCGECKFMFPRMAVGGCRYVRGLIRPTDTCDEFMPRGRRADGPPS